MSQNFISTQNFQSVIENIITTNILNNNTPGAANNPTPTSAPTNPIPGSAHDVELGNMPLANNTNNNNIDNASTVLASNNSFDSLVSNANNNFNNSNNNINIANNANPNPIVANNNPQNPPVQIDFSLATVSKVLAYVGPFSLLFLLVFIIKHVLGFLVFAWLFVLLSKANTRLKQEILKKENRDQNVLAGIIIVLAVNFIWPLVVFREVDHLYQGLLMIPLEDEDYDLWRTLWTICVNDTLVKYISIMIKCAYGIVLGNKPPFRKRATIYSFIESVTSCYRTILPIPLWVKFFMNDWDFSNLLSACAIMFYLILKFPRAYEKLMIAIITLKSVLKGHLRFGTYATRDQVLEVGDQCAICQEAMNAPVILSCKHIFCEECVGAWFEKEKTCPLCRAEIQGTGNLPCADGSTTLVPELF